MRFFTCHIFLVFFTFFLASSPANARDLVLNLEYYRTNNYDSIERIKNIEEHNKEKKQMLLDDIENADESTRRTLQVLQEIFEWYKNIQYREVLTVNDVVFSQDFIIAENEARSYGVNVRGGWLDTSFDAGTKKQHSIPVGIKIVFNGENLFSDGKINYPMDKLILLHESYISTYGYRKLEILFMKISRCSPDLCKSTPEKGRSF